MKRTCEGCKASSLDGIPLYRCELMFNIDRIKGKPLEECPKPKTYDRFIELIELRRKNN